MNTVLQIGEGNFLRAFAENYVQDINNYQVVICQPRTNTKVIDALKAQNCEYSVVIKGRLNGEVINSSKKIDCVSAAVDVNTELDKLFDLAKSDDLKIIISNTTEAGICFNADDSIDNYLNITYPAKLTKLLLERFNASKDGVVVLPVELIENNADELKACINKYIELWSLSNDFKAYVNSTCAFCNTLVDRIVTGKVEFEDDNCAVACEPYKSWIIEADENTQKLIPFNDVTFTDSLLPYRNRKVRILNGLHTMSVLAAYHMGYKIVRDMMGDELIKKYIANGLNEIIPTIELDEKELYKFADSVLERFDNPFIDHKLLDISLNSVSKFKARCLGTMLDYYNTNNAVPKTMCFALAALINFYVNKTDYQPNDSDSVLEFFASEHSDLVGDTLKNIDFWGEDISCFYDEVNKNYNNIISLGVQKAMEICVNE